MATWYLLGQEISFPAPGIGMPGRPDGPHPRVIATSPASKNVLLQAAIEGHVLVKNTKQTLPLKAPKLLAVFGYDAKGPESLETGHTPSQPSTPGTQNHTQWVGGGSGANSPAYIDVPIDALQRQAYEDGSSMWWDFNSQDPVIDTSSDVCLVFINSYASEGSDRSGLTDEYSDTMIGNITSKCSNTIVVYSPGRPLGRS